MNSCKAVMMDRFRFGSNADAWNPASFPIVGDMKLPKEQGGRHEIVHPRRGPNETAKEDHDRTFASHALHEQAEEAAGQIVPRSGHAVAVRGSESADDRRGFASARLARGHRGVPPRADVGSALVIAVHHIEWRAAAGLGDADADVARLLAAFGREPGAVVAPQARAFRTLVRRPVVDVDRAAAPAVFEQEFRWRP